MLAPYFAPNFFQDPFGKYLQFHKTLTTWWFSTPFEKYALDHFPNFRGENKTSLKPPPRLNTNTSRAGTYQACSLPPRHWKCPGHGSWQISAMNSCVLSIWGYIWPNGIIFHQPRFPWNKRISLTKPSFGVVWGRHNLTRSMLNTTLNGRNPVPVSIGSFSYYLRIRNWGLT